ncbi:hypothetical protein EC991_010474, partial [Linnemannia zychae]
MALFKSNKNQSASAASTPSQSPRTSIDANHKRPTIEGNSMTREQAIRLAMHNAQQKLPHHFSLL